MSLLAAAFVNAARPAVHLPAGPLPSAPPHDGLCITVVCPSQIIDAGSGLASGLASGVAKQAAGSVLDAVGSGLTDAAAWVVAHVMGLIQSTTAPDMGAGWFTTELSLMEQVALTVILPVLMIATISSVLRQDGRRLFRVWAVGLPVGLFAGLAGSQLAGWALAATDALCGIVTGSHSQDLGSQFAKAMTSSTIAGAPLFVQIILAVLTLCGAVLVWLELTVRSAGVYVATFFMPLALIAYIWPATVGVARRAVEILASLILSKFVIVASISLGLAALTGGGVDAPLSGAAILLIAAFAPFSLFRLAPVVEASVIGHLEGMSRRPGRAAMRTATTAAASPTHPLTQMVMSTAARGGGSGTAGNGGLDTRAVVAQHLPMAVSNYPGSTGRGDSGSSGKRGPDGAGAANG